MPPTAKIPVPPANVAARQVGERVVLRWTVRRAYSDGTRAEGWPRLAVYRAFVEGEAPSRKAFAEQAELAYLIPDQVVDTFLEGGWVVFPDVLRPDILEKQKGRTAVYAVKALSEKDRDAGFSNLASVRLYPVPRPIALVRAEVTEEAIVLRWDPPRRTTGGTPLDAIAGYRVFRSRTGEDSSFSLHGTAPSSLYRDRDVRFGQTYFYRVRTLAQFGADTVQSADSAPVEVTARDLFPPPAPTGLIAVAGVKRVDLTWEASPAADLAGYYVYRRHSSDEDLQRLNDRPRRAQSFADTGLEAGVRYRYAVTAVDEEGNESPYSSEVTATPRTTD